MILAAAWTSPGHAEGGLFAQTPGSAGGRRVSALAVPAGTACSGVSNATASPDTSAPAGSSGIFVQRFTAPSAAFTPTSVCVAGFSGIATAEPYDVVIYADAGGVPGALLGAVAAPPAQPGTFPGTWTTTIVPGVPPITGSFWAGVKISSGLDFNMDFDTTVPSVPTAISNDGVTFSALYSFQAAAIVVSGSEVSSVPALSGFGLAGVLVALAASGFFVLRRT